jgi:hypothetical protein
VLVAWLSLTPLALLVAVKAGAKDCLAVFADEGAGIDPAVVVPPPGYDSSGRTPDSRKISPITAAIMLDARSARWTRYDHTRRRAGG